MSEAELAQSAVAFINLAYTSSQWWLTVTTALIVATYFAAKQIPPWLFALVISLYALTAISVIFEVSEYTQASYSYGARLLDLQLAQHVLGVDGEPPLIIRMINGYLNYAIFAIGSFCAAAFSFRHWKKTRFTG